MSTQALINWLGAALVASLVTMLVSASAGGITPAGASAALFAASIVAASIAVNQPLWKAGPADVSPDRGPKIAQFNARLMALVYAWGSLLLLVVYPLSGMRWYHAYQYGAGTGLFAAGLLAYSICVGSKGSTMRASRALSSVVLLAAIQGLAALGGLAFLIGSGKLSSTRVDWLANQVFAFGGIAILALSAIAVITQRKLLR